MNEKLYTIHYHIHMGYDVTVKATDEETAMKRAKRNFLFAEPTDYFYIDCVNEGITHVADPKPTKEEQYCRVCDNWKCRCNNCIALTEKNGSEWFCDEMQNYCKDITECPEYDDQTCEKGETK